MSKPMLRAGQSVEHKGNKWTVVGMINDKLVKIRRGDFSRMVKVSQVREI